MLKQEQKFRDPKTSLGIKYMTHINKKQVEEIALEIKQDDKGMVNRKKETR